GGAGRGGGGGGGGAPPPTTAATITKLLGNAYVAVLYDFCQKHPGKDIDLAMIAQALKQRLPGL
ncbi:GTPase, partial [Bordetella avium]